MLQQNGSNLFQGSVEHTQLTNNVPGISLSKQNEKPGTQDSGCFQNYQDLKATKLSFSK